MIKPSRTSSVHKRAITYAKYRIKLPLITCLLDSIKTQRNIRKYADATHRKLEIGPGTNRIHGFETLNIVDGPDVDYICDAGKRLPFLSNTYEIIYASHILEHIPWYLTQSALAEWVRILKPNGFLEVWVPDGLKIIQTLYEYEVNHTDNTDLDGWYRFNEERDVCKWAAGRIFTYGDGTGKTNHPNWHRALFTPRYLTKLMMNIGLIDVHLMERNEVRGYDHGWINLGIRGTKP